MFRLLATIVLAGLGFFAISKSLSTMSGPDGSISGLIVAVFIGSLLLAGIIGVWSSGSKKTVSKSK